MEVKFFTAEDFEKQKLWDAMMQTHPTNPYGVILSVIADIANAKLERNGIRLFGTASDGGISFDWTVGVNKEDTHTALLVQIEEIEK